MSLATALTTAMRRWYVMLAGALLGLVVASFAAAQPVQYRAGTDAMITVSGTGTPTEVSDGSRYALDQMKTFELLAGSPLTLDRAADKINANEPLESFRRRVRVETLPETTILRISVVDSDVTRAAQSANAVAEEFARTVARIWHLEGVPQALVSVRTLTEATPSAATPLARSSSMVLIGGVVGLCIGIGLALVPDIYRARKRPQVTADPTAQ